MAKTIGGQIRDLPTLIPGQPGDIIMVQVNKIIVTKDRFRIADSEKVQYLARNLKTGVLLNPITVNNNMELIAGLHRLEAYKLLRRKEIPCRILNIDEKQARLLEIDENLSRTEFTELEKGEALTEKVELMKELYMRGKPEYEEFKKDSANFALPRKIMNEISETTGLSKRSIYLKMQIVRNLDEKVKDVIRYSELENNQACLEKISKLEPQDQMSLARSVVYKDEDFNESYKKITQKKVHAASINYEEEGNQANFLDDVDPELYEGYVDISERTDYFPMRPDNTQRMENIITPSIMVEISMEIYNIALNMSKILGISLRGTVEQCIKEKAKLL